VESSIDVEIGEEVVSDIGCNNDVYNAPTADGISNEVGGNGELVPGTSPIPTSDTDDEATPLPLPLPCTTVPMLLVCLLFLQFFAQSFLPKFIYHLSMIAICHTVLLVPHCAVTAVAVAVCQGLIVDAPGNPKA